VARLRVVRPRQMRRERSHGPGSLTIHIYRAAAHTLPPTHGRHISPHNSDTPSGHCLHGILGNGCGHSVPLRLHLLTCTYSQPTQRTQHILTSFSPHVHLHHTHSHLYSAHTQSTSRSRNVLRLPSLVLKCLAVSRMSVTQHSKKHFFIKERRDISKSLSSSCL